MIRGEMASQEKRKEKRQTTFFIFKSGGVLQSQRRMS